MEEQTARLVEMTMFAGVCVAIVVLFMQLIRSVT